MESALVICHNSCAVPLGEEGVREIIENKGGGKFVTTCLRCGHEISMPQWVIYKILAEFKPRRDQ